MSSLRFRNIDVTPDDPVEKWGVEGILTAIDRGSLPHWRRIVIVVRADPWGPVAADLDQALTLAEDVGVSATLRRVLTHAREDVDAAARAEVRRRLQQLVEKSGLTAAEFAQRLGTSASRVSTYLNGKVVPSAALLVRFESVSERASQIQRGTGRVRSRGRDHSGPQANGAAMSDKSPRQTMTKKSGKSLKEKRADKRAKAERTSSTDALLHPKKH